MTDTERTLLNDRLTALEAENAALRQRLQVIIDRAAPAPSEEPGEGVIAVRVSLSRGEWRFVAGEGPP